MQLDYAAAWLQAFLRRASGFSFDDEQIAQVSGLAERKLRDLFDVAQEAAMANGRALIMRHDLPLTKGLRASLGDAEAMASDQELRPLLVFLADAGVAGPFDDAVRAEIPRLMAALLLLAGRVIAVVEPADMTTEERLDRLLRSPSDRPTRWELERAARVLDMTL